MGKNNKKFTFKEVNNIFEENGCVLLEDKYVNNRTPMKFRCSCGNISYARLDAFKRGRRCQKCKGIRSSKRQKHSLEYIKKYFEDYDYELLETEYRNAKTLMKFKCPEGHIGKINFSNFKTGKRCRKCYDDNNYGENSNGWKGGYINPRTGVLQYLSVAWRKKVYSKDNYTCQKCGQRGGRLNAHHIKNFHDDVSERYEVDNGATMCEDHHREFHKIYGKKNTNIEQYKEFVRGAKI